MSLTRRGNGDLRAARERIASGASAAAALVEASLTAADTAADCHAFIRRFDARARTVAAAIDRGLTVGMPLPPLAALAIERLVADAEG